MSRTQSTWASQSTPLTQFIPSVFFIVMEGMVFLLAAILPLYYLQALVAFPDALVSHLAKISELSAILLFPHYTLVQVYPRPHIPKPVAIERSWKQTGLLLASILLVCLSYVLSLRYLPRYISQRFIFVTTGLLGLTCVFFFSAFTSADVFSYIIYARMVVIYHLNPLIALPTAISHDPVYQYLYWTKQPSIYGPVWIWITSVLQWTAFAGGLKSASYMVVILRVWGLAMHLASTALIWSTTGYLQRSKGGFLFENRRRRLLATLTFAWNPLLLFEACVNAHVDATVLFFVLLSLWLLVREKEQGRTPGYLLIAVVFALACCIKVNVVLLFPGLLLFLWGQRPRQLLPVATSIFSFLAAFVLIYAPFWGHGALLNVLHDNPAGRLNVNTFPDFLSSLYYSLLIIASHPSHHPITALPISFVSHFVSISIFVVFYGMLCWGALHKPASISTPAGLVRWMMLAWLLYCIVGAPWFWPWYTVTFFGLYALVEATDYDTVPSGRTIAYFKRPLSVYLLILSMLGIYVFNTWVMFHSIVPGLPKFLWAYFRGCVWILPLFALRLRPRSVAIAVPEQDTQKLPETRRREMVAMLHQKLPIFGHSGRRISA